MVDFEFIRRNVPELFMIKNVTIREWVESVYTDEVDVRFWNSPASFSGKFHLVPDGSGRVDTQLDGCRRAARVAAHLAVLYGLSPYGSDIVIASALLHDIQAGFPEWDKTNDKHAAIAAVTILSTKDKYDYDTELWSWMSDVIEYVAYCVQHHMAWWGTTDWMHIYGSDDDKDWMATIVAIADYISCQKDIWVQLPEDIKKLSGETEEVVKTKKKK